MSKKILSFLLSIVMLITIAPVSVFAEDETVDVLSYLTYEINDGNVTITDCDTSISGEVVIPDTIEGYPVTSIASKAFDWCETIESITIPNSVTEIGTIAFRSCTSLKSITIPDSVTTIGDSAFSYCTSLESITVDENNQYYSSDEYGALLNKDKTELIQYPKGNSITTYTIPDSVTTIGGYAFYNCESLTSVTIGNSVTSIGAYAFWNCDSLESITIPDSVITIEYTAFNSCDSLKSIIVDENNPNYSSDEYGVLFIKDKSELILYPTGNSRTAYIIPDSVTTICMPAFNDCTSLESIIIPDSVTTISLGAFYNTAYYNNEDNWDNGVLYIGNHLIDAKRDITECKIKDGTLTIPDHAFWFSESLESVVIPGSVITIGDYAFEKCYNLESITISDSEATIGNDAFLDTAYYNNEDNWDNGVLYIGNHLIEAKTDITECEINDGTLTIADHAFWYCNSLESITIPDSVTTIGDYAFAYCYNIDVVYYGGSQEDWESIEIGDMNSYITSKTIHYNCTDIENHYTTEVVPPTCYNEGYTKYTCACGYSYEDDYVDALNPDGGHDYVGVVTEPGCSDGYTTYTCTICGESYVGDKTEAVHDFDGFNCKLCGEFALQYEIVDGNAVINNCYKSFNGDIVIPETIEGYPVTKIENSAFWGCESIKTIKIHKNIETIESSAFAFCTNLEKIIVDENNKYYSSDEYGVLYNKDKTMLLQYPAGSKMESYTIPDSVTSIGYSVEKEEYEYEYEDGTTYTETWIYTDSCYIFGGAQNLKHIILPDNLVSIGNFAFAGCTSLESVDFNENLKYITSYAFSGCTGLKELKLPDSVEFLGEGAFYRCFGLEEVTLGSGITELEFYPFGICTGLKIFRVPVSLTRFGFDCFVGWESITDIYYEGTEEDWNNIAMDDYWYGGYISDAVVHYNWDPDESASVPDEITTVPDETTTVLDESTTVYDETTTISEETTTVSDETTTVPDETTTVPDETTTVPDETTTILDETTTVPDETTTVPDETTTVPDEITTVPDETTTVPDETTTVSDETTTVPDETTTVPDETTTVPDETTTVPDETTTSDKSDNEQSSELVIKSDSNIFVDKENKTVTITSNTSVTDALAQFENDSIKILTADGSDIAETALVGTGCVIIVNDVVRYDVIVPGDIDGNGSLTAADARLVLRASAQLDTLEGVYITAANVDGNDKITAADARTILRVSAKLETL